MDQFVQWAFYGKKIDILTPEEVYQCYLIWCKLFKYNPIKKFEFIQEWGKYENSKNRN